MRSLERWRLRSFKHRLLTLIVGLVFIAECVTVVLTLVSLSRAVEDQAKSDLRDAQQVMNNTLADRNSQLRSAAAVLVADFAFKEAIGSDDRATIASVLRNHSGRVAADIAVLYDTNGGVIAATIPRAAAATQSPAQLEGVLSNQNYSVIDGRAYMLVYATLKAPQPIATVALGFALDDDLARQLARVTNAEIAFVAQDSAQVHVTSGLPAATVMGARAGLLRTESAAGPSSVTLDRVGYLASMTSLVSRSGTIELVMLRRLDSASELFGKMLPVFLLIGLATLFAAILIASVSSRAAIRPLARLVEAARRIAAGDYQHQAEIQGDEEFEQLGGAFNQMCNGIREREQHIYDLAMRDSLTGLASRAAFLQQLSERSSVAGPLTLVVLDIRRFRDVNASVGFQAGSRLLCQLAERLKKVAGEGGLSARLAADLFAVCASVDDSRMRERLIMLAAELRAGLAIDGVTLGINVRCGVAVNVDGLATDDFLRRASVALVEAKENNLELVVFKPHHDLDHQRRITLVADLRKAIANGELTLMYQPLTQMTTGQAIMAEALVRWRHPTLGDISPNEFIPLAERASLISDLSRWVLAAAIAQLGRWQQQSVELHLAVNLSATDLSDVGMPMRVVSLLQEYHVPAAQLLLEVTESTIMEKPELAANLMMQLRTAGVRFAVDDFGTGHSSLAQLHALPVDELKIDRAFVTRLDDTPANQAIVRSTIELGHILGLQVVAEGVETPEVWAMLLKMGCDIAQGYFISRPMSAEQLREWLSAQRTRLDKARTDAESRGQLTALRPRTVRE